jgi:preprotein translocase subunit YajC
MMPQSAFLIQLVLIVAIFYFLVIRPQKQKEKEHKQMLSNLAKNDVVVTSAGIHGTIVGVKDTTVVVRVDENVKIEMDKNCIVVVKKNQGVEKP